MKKLCCFLMAAFCVFAFAGCGETDDPDQNVNKTPFENPVWPSFADPCIIRDDDGTFYVYATAGRTQGEDNAWASFNIPIVKSKDLVNYEFVGEVFESIPTWKNKDCMLWAPDIVKIGSTYNLYYSLVAYEEDHNPGIGVATAPTPVGPFTDHGKILTVEDSGVNNGIDPCVFVEEGTNKVYMTWGSFRGIYGVELTADGLAVKNPDTLKEDVVLLAGKETSYPADFEGTFEGSYVRYINGYYYIFLSQGYCCGGLTGSSYHVKVGRSENPLGPYVYGKESKSLIGTDTGNLVVRGSIDAVGPGHNAIIQDDAGEYWIVYHSYVSTSSAFDRSLFIDKLLWDEDGYPYVLNQKPHLSNTESPYIATK